MLVLPQLTVLLLPQLAAVLLASRLWTTVADKLAVLHLPQLEGLLEPADVKLLHKQPMLQLQLL